MVFDPDTLESVDVNSLGSASDFAAASKSQSQSGKHEDAYGIDLGCQTHTHQTHTHMGAHTHLNTHTVANSKHIQHTYTSKNVHVTIVMTCRSAYDVYRK
jgi:hypothetical protein